MAALAACASSSSSPPAGQSKSIFETPDWARFGGPAEKNLEFGRPAAPEDMVDAAGLCVAGMQSAPDSAPPPTVAGSPAINPNDIPLGGGAGGLAPGVTGGGVALGMSECDVVRRAGQPGGVNISANEAGERTAVLTYLSGNWPGIYHFASGRLKEIVRAPEPPAPPKPPPKKKKPAKPNTADRPPARS